MNEQDKAAARRALEQQRLSIEQVQEIRAEVDRTGRSFEDVARSRGLLLAPPAPPPAAPAPAPVARPLPPPTPRPPFRMEPRQMALLGAAAVVLIALIVSAVAGFNQILERTAHDQELAVESSKNMSEADRQYSEAVVGYKRSLVQRREAIAAQSLVKAREAMARADALLKGGTASPELPPALNEAFVGYNAYLDVLPDDADVRIERARTHQLRRNFDLAIVDLERAAELKPDRAPALRDQVAQLRLLLARTPK
jgi:hypothetical protein